QAEDGIRDFHVTGVQTCALPISAVRRREAPTPTIAPVIVWVVLTGIPKCAVPTKVSAPAVSAAKPPKGVSFVMRWPIVLMMRQRSEERRVGKECRSRRGCVG